ncbi:MAG TPA: hypothetical protein VGB07_36330 [Blastocatellia bacterium]
MLQFENGKFTKIDPASVLPKYDSPVSVDEQYEDAGFNRFHYVGPQDGVGFALTIWIKEGEGGASVFDLELLGVGFEEVYCPDHIQRLEFLLKLAPYIQVAILDQQMCEMRRNQDRTE